MVIVCRGTEKPKTIKYIEYLEATGTQWIDTGESIIKDYRPCLDDNGTPCMWENVSKEYVYNSGTGSFVSGPEV